jgi:hypothetical protein
MKMIRNAKFGGAINKRDKTIWELEFDTSIQDVCKLNMSSI